MKPSQSIHDRLLLDAQNRDRPEVRLATIGRLVLACDAIERGDAIWIDEAIRHKHSLRSRERDITPSNIEKFVKAMRQAGHQEWTGPTRPFIQNDPDLLSYVRARGLEHPKLHRPKRPSDRFKNLTIAVDQVRDPELRLLVMQDLEKGRAAQQKLDILWRGLSQFPSVDVNALLRGAKQPSSKGGTDLNRQLTDTHPHLTEQDRACLVNMVARLFDPDEMSRCGLMVDGDNRLKLAFPPGTTIIRPAEMDVLLKLTGGPGGSCLPSPNTMANQGR